MCRYWPEDGPTEFGPLVVEPLETTEYKGVTGGTFSLKNKDEEVTLKNTFRNGAQGTTKPSFR